MSEYTPPGDKPEENSPFEGLPDLSSLNYADGPSLGVNPQNGNAEVDNQLPRTWQNEELFASVEASADLPSRQDQTTDEGMGPYADMPRLDPGQVQGIVDKITAKSTIEPSPTGADPYQEAEQIYQQRLDSGEPVTETTNAVMCGVHNTSLVRSNLPGRVPFLDRPINDLIAAADTLNVNPLHLPDFTLMKPTRRLPNVHLLRISSKNITRRQSESTNGY